MDIIVSLIKRCKNNDKEAMNQLLSRFEGYIYKICYVYTGNQQDALDVMQEVFFKVFRSIDTFEETRPFLPWLKKITINTCLNYKRDNKSKNNLSLDSTVTNVDDKNSTSYQDLIADKVMVEELVIARQHESILKKHINQLPGNYKAPLVLKYLEGMSYEEIAGILNKPVSTVKNHLFRARSRLKKELEQENLLEV